MASDVLSTVFLTNGDPVVVSRVEQVVVPTRDAAMPSTVTTAGCEIGVFRRALATDEGRSRFLDLVAMTLARLRKVYRAASSYADDVVLRQSDDGRLLVATVWADFVALRDTTGESLRNATGLSWVDVVPQYCLVPQAQQIASHMDAVVSEGDRSDPLFQEAMAYLCEKIRFE